MRFTRFGKSNLMLARGACVTAAAVVGLSLGVASSPAGATSTPVGPVGYTYVATEGDSFTISGIADVAYGASGKFNRKTAMTGRIECGNSTFGDPDVHVHKSCYILKLVGPAGYTYAASEGAHITITGIADVAYGDNGKFLRKTGVIGGIDCTNDVFGDPDVHVHKSCYVQPV